MKEKKLLVTRFGFLLTVSLIELALFAVVGLICWLAGWRSAYQYGKGLIIGGIAAIALGILSLGGRSTQTRSFRAQYAQSVSAYDAQQRTTQELSDARKSSSFLARTTSAGILSIIIGILLKRIGAGP